jgi:hypothetical protein
MPGQVGRTHDALRGWKPIDELAPPPGVVPERDRVGAGAEDFRGEAGRQPDAVGRVLAVDHADVDVELLAQ